MDRFRRLPALSAESRRGSGPVQGPQAEPTHLPGGEPSVGRVARIPARSSEAEEWMNQLNSTERLGAHVSAQGGVDKAPVRGKAIGATAIQVFTKTPNQWREPSISPESVATFRRECERLRLCNIVAHDSYLINLASPDRTLSVRSEASFVAELQRCEAFGIPYLVSHPG